MLDTKHTYALVRRVTDYYEYIFALGTNGTRCSFLYIYRPQRSWGKVIFSQASVILSTAGGSWSRGGGAWSWVGWGGAWSWGVPGGDPPGRLLLRAVRILLECILVNEMLVQQNHSSQFFTPLEQTGAPI